MTTYIDPALADALQKRINRLSVIYWEFDKAYPEQARLAEAVHNEQYELVEQLNKLRVA